MDAYPNPDVDVNPIRFRFVQIIGSRTHPHRRESLQHAENL